LWEGRFYSCTPDEKGFWLAAKYVELNPVRAKICRLPWRYKWSSAAAHIGENTQNTLLDLKTWNKQISVKEWQKN
jgi:putative transposase